MKKLVFISLAMLLFIGINTVSAQSSTRTTNNAVYSVKVEFHCANGEATIEKELPKKPGIVKVVANLDTKIVDVTYDKTAVNPKRIVSYFHELGFLTADSPKGTVLTNRACSHSNSTPATSTK